MAVFALSTTGRIEVWVGLGLLVWLVLSACVALYGSSRGYPFFPLFVCGIFLGFPLVLLVVTVAPRRAER